MSEPERTALATREFRGRFWKPCPGTTGGYLCCGYQILSPMVGCGMYCRYCILQTYLQQQSQVVFSNFDDLCHEVHDGLARWRGVVRFGTGELADSLYPEAQLGLSRRVAELLEPYPNVLVEFKTKSDRVDTLRSIREKRKVVVGFSMSTEAMIAAYERGPASLAQRLAAVRRCEEMGFWVALHFDPMIHYPAWEREYREVVRAVFGAVRDPANIAWWSLGGLRAPPALKRLLAERGEHLPLFGGEMIRGADGKLRYYRPIRVSFYRAMDEEVRRHAPETTLYLCMESPEVWRDAGMGERIAGGLPGYLDRRAETMLGL